MATDKNIKHQNIKQIMNMVVIVTEVIEELTPKQKHMYISIQPNLGLSTESS